MANTVGLSMSLSWSELMIHICEMGSADHGDPPIPPTQDSSPQMPSQAPLSRMILTGGRELYVLNSGAALEGRLQRRLLSFPSPWP